MAQLRNKRAQAIAEQEAMLRRGGRSYNSGGDGSLGLLGMRAPNEFGQTSIFSKKPEVNLEYNPGLAVGNPYLDNTKAGKRMNLKEFQMRQAEGEAIRANKLAQANAIEMENLQSGNNIKEKLTISQDAFDKMDATTKTALIRKGRAMNPKATDEEAMVLGAQLENTESMSKEGERKAREPHLGKNAEATSGALQREANSKDVDYFKRRNSAEIAASKAKGFVDIGQGGSVDNNTGNIYKPGSSKIVNNRVPPTYGPDGKILDFGGTIEKLISTDPGIVGGGSKAKIDMSKYSDPSAVPDLDTNSNGNSANPKGGSTSTVQTTDSYMPPQIPLAPTQQPNILTDFIKSAEPAGYPTPPVIPSFQAPPASVSSSPSMESVTSFDNPFKQKANPFGIPAPQEFPTIPLPTDGDPVYGFPKGNSVGPNMQQPPQAIPQIPQPQTQTQLGVPPAPGAKPQAQLTVPDIMGLIQQFLSKPKAQAPSQRAPRLGF